MDDAGISSAYARSLATGAGFVGQPGAVPVEGFTNGLWVLLLAAPFGLGMADPVWVPKLLGFLLVGGAFLLVASTLCRDDGQPRWVAALALAICASSPGFALWTVSGLENALWAFLVALLVAAGSRIALGSNVAPEPVKNARGLAAASGALVLLLYLTRPEAILLLGLVPFLLGARIAGPGARSLLIRHGLAFASLWVLVTAFRFATFGDVVPNTFYAKGGEGYRQILWILESGPPAAGAAAFGALALTLAAFGMVLCFLAGRAWGRFFGSPSPGRAALGAALVLAWTAYLALPSDWMPEHRFATPIFLLAPAFALAQARATALRMFPRRAEVLTAVLAIVWLLASGTYAARRTPALLPKPTIAFDDVRALSRRLSAVADAAGAPGGTILLPDIGGALWENRFQVIDLVGLCDRVVARTQKLDRPAYYEYLLGTRRPDLIWVHSVWARSAALWEDPRFERDYVTIGESRSSGEPAPEWGLYLRRDRSSALEAARRAFER